MTRISATELARRLSDILSRVHYKGEQFVVERGGDSIAMITPTGAKPGITWAEFVRLLNTGPRPDEAFADDLERIQAAQPPAVEEFPAWPS
jgi:antitoxin (DNA-binding transcriptional repressor) of toxin-antitoxin stability system